MTRSTSEPMAVSMMTGGPFRARSFWQRTSPLSPGIMRSSTTRSNRPDLNRVQHFAPVGGLRDPEAMLGQVFADQGAQFAVVINNKDVTDACAQERAPD